MTPIRILADAEEELRDAVAYYDDLRDGLGAEFLVEFREGVRAIQQTPDAWALVSRRSRRRQLSRFPYGLIYQVGHDEILVIAVMHLRRRPGYWLDRER
jgi:plasmid stabilization system protein ParE